MNNLDPIEFILSVVDSNYQKKPSFGEIVENKDFFLKTIREAEKNGLYYYFVLRLKNLEMDLPYLDRARLEKEERKLSSFKEAIGLLNAVSKRSKIDYIVIKASNMLPHVPKDIDIFVPPEEKDKAIKALEKEGIKCLRSDDIETILTKGENIKIDVYTRITYFGIECMDGQFLLNSVTNDEIFGVEYQGLNKEANFLLMAIHSLFGHGAMTLLDFLHLKLLIEDGVDLNACHEYANEKGWGYAFDGVVERIEYICEKIYENGEIVIFPYSFEWKFILNSIYGLEGLKLSNANKMFLYFSLIWDRIFFGKMKNSWLYNTARSIEPIRRFINFVGYSIRHHRGDRYS